MAKEIGVSADKIISAVKQFTGLKRRLEKRLVGDVMVFDDIAHSPEKALSVLLNLRSIYTGKLIAIFEPNIGGRERSAEIKYENAFKPADIVIIPRLTALKVAEGVVEKPMEGDELTVMIAKTHPDTRYVEDDTKLVELLASTAQKGDVIVFLGSHGFRGMIEETIKKIDLISN
jgi:UDP-N-acetylmuramate: L-alanyl-gamma-D-glutamyl-meso-diaminopimelate ligase